MCLINNVSEFYIFYNVTMSVCGNFSSLSSFYIIKKKNFNLNKSITTKEKEVIV